MKNTTFKDPGDPFNIDAKLNGAYIVIGLLYGKGDIDKTFEITTRWGQDSDCNPSNAMALLGIINGYSHLPEKWKISIDKLADSSFSFTNYSFNKAVKNTFGYALKNIQNNGGKTSGEILSVAVQMPKAPIQEESFPMMVPDKTVSVFDSAAWVKKGSWKSYDIDLWWVTKPYKQAIYAEKGGDEISIDFDGKGVSLMGNWLKNGGKADIYLDDKFIRTIDTWYLWGYQQEANMSLFHSFRLSPCKHNLRLVVKGEKNERSQGCRIYITELRVLKTAPKINENYKFSFER